jgi:hypothetical protein
VIDSIFADGSTPVLAEYDPTTGLCGPYTTPDGKKHFPAQPGIEACGDRFDGSLNDPDWDFAIVDMTTLRINFGVRSNGVIFDGTLAAISTARAFPDLWHVILHGQSLAEGDDAFPLVTPSDTGWGSVSFTRGIQTWSSSDHPTTPASRAASGFDLQVLHASAGSYGETCANGLADGLKASVAGRYQPLPQASTAPHVMVSYAGRGSTRLTQVGPEDTGRTDGRDTWAAPGGYWLTMLDDVARAKAAAAVAGYSYAVAGMLWMQGEREGDGKI